MSVKRQRPGEATAWLPPIPAKYPHTYRQQGRKAPRQRGNKMQTAIIIFAGTAATGLITALLLRWQHDPYEEEIQDAMQYESKQLKIKKALNK